MTLVVVFYKSDDMINIYGVVSFSFERARLASLVLPHAGDWLNTAPFTALGLHLRPAEFVMMAKYRLGLPVYDRPGPCPACLCPSDTLGDYALFCGTGGEQISRHNHLRDAL